MERGRVYNLHYNVCWLAVLSFVCYLKNIWPSNNPPKYCLMLRLKLTVTDFLELERNFRLPILTSFHCRRSYVSSDSTISYCFLFLENWTLFTMELSLPHFPFFSNFGLLLLLTVMIGATNLSELSVFLNNGQGRLLAKHRRSF